MSILSALFCLVLVAVFVVLLWAMFSPRSNKRKGALSSAVPPKMVHKGWQSWIGYLGVALVLSLWSIFAALFFLAVVWILRKNPNPDASFLIGNEEKKKARRVYTWLFLSPILTVPAFLIVILFSKFSGSLTNNESVLIALVPLLFHLPLLLGLTSRSAFVYRHTQLGILLIALRAGMAAIALSMDSSDGIWLFLFGNGFLWLFSSIWGWIEVSQGACWLMKQKGDVLTGGKEKEAALPPGIEPQAQLTPEKYIEYSRRYLKYQRKGAAKECALEAFRHGNFAIRRQAVQVLDEMNEVEFF